MEEIFRVDIALLYTSIYIYVNLNISGLCNSPVERWQIILIIAITLNASNARYALRTS